MTEKFREVLSAAVDDEVTIYEFRQLFEEFENDPELSAKWSRYHVAKNAIEKMSAKGRCCSMPSPMEETPDWQTLSKREPPDWDRDEGAEDPVPLSSIFKRRAPRRAIVAIAAAATAAVAWLMYLSLFNIPQSEPSGSFTPPSELVNIPPESPLSYPDLVSGGASERQVGESHWSLTDDQRKRLDSYWEMHARHLSLTQANPRLDTYARFVVRSP